MEKYFYITHSNYDFRGVILKPLKALYPISV